MLFRAATSTYSTSAITVLRALLALFHLALVPPSNYRSRQYPNMSQCASSHRATRRRRRVPTFHRGQ